MLGCKHNIEAKPGDYEITVGDPASGKVVEYTMSPHASALVYRIYGDQNGTVRAGSGDALEGIPILFERRITVRNTTF
jgi:hypothetical protein